MLFESVQQLIANAQMIPPRSRVLVGVSGGVDSVVLLHLLARLRKPLNFVLHAAYVNHHLRPKAALQEAALVKALGKQLQVPTHVLSRKVRPAKQESIEMAARRVRYKALAALALKERCSRIALAHTQDDQAETVLMWLVRGTGLTGLAGMPAVRELQECHQGRGKPRLLIRPLLSQEKGALRNYAQEQGLEYLEDASNQSNVFYRNQIRNELLPLLEQKYNPKIREKLSGMAQGIQEDLACLETQVSEVYGQIAHATPKRLKLEKEQLQHLSPAMQRQILRKGVVDLVGSVQGFRRKHWLDLEDLVAQPQRKAVDLPRNLRAHWQGPQLVVGFQSARKQKS